MTTDAPVPVTDFYLDVDDTYQPRELPQGKVKMGGKEYPVRCPKDSLPILLAEFQKEMGGEGKSEGERGKEIIQAVLAAAFEPQDVAEIMERVLDPYERVVSVAFVLHTVRRIYEAYAPLMDEQYSEMGLDNPMAPARPQPQDRLPSSKKQRPKAAPKKRAPAALPSA